MCLKLIGDRKMEEKEKKIEINNTIGPTISKIVKVHAPNKNK